VEEAEPGVEDEKCKEKKSFCDIYVSVGSWPHTGTTLQRARQSGLKAPAGAFERPGLQR